VTGRIGASALLHLISHIISEFAFDQLRTKEQLGYIVHTSTVKIGVTLGMRIIVQSSDKDASYLDERIESFLEGFRELLASMSADILSSNIKAVIELLLERPKNLQKETSRFWGEINSGSYLFDRNEKEADFLRSVTLQDASDFFCMFISPLSTVRTKFSSQFFGARQPYPLSTPAGVTLIRNHIAFKRSMPLLEVVDNSEVVALATRVE
jgi:insulysin